MVLQGEVCRLRSVVSSDVGTILLWENDPALAAYSDPHPPYCREEIEQFVENQQLGFAANGQIRLMIEVGTDVVGAIDLFDYNAGGAEVGILIYPEQYRSKGYGRDALKTVQYAARSLGIDTLYATVEPQNSASKALFCSCGFVNFENNRYICRCSTLDRLRGSLFRE